MSQYFYIGFDDFIFKLKMWLTSLCSPNNSQSINTVFGCFDKILFDLSTTSDGLSIASFAIVIGALVWTRSTNFLWLMELLKKL